MSQQPGNDDPTIQPANPPAAKPNHDASTAAYQDSTPKPFGRYRVVSMHGKGGFGAVYRAVDDQLERDVAIKVTLGSLLDPSMRQGFFNEARIVASLDHPNIVPVLDVGQTENGRMPRLRNRMPEGAELTDNVKYWVGRSDFYLTLSSESDSQAKALRLAYNCGFLGSIPKISALLLESFADWHVPRNQSGVFAKSPHFLLESFAGGNRLRPLVSVLMGTCGNGVRTHNAAQLLFASAASWVSLLQAWPQLISSGSSIV